MMDGIGRFFDKFSLSSGTKKPPVSRPGKSVQFEKSLEQLQLGPNTDNMTQDDKSGKDAKGIWIELC